jgi:hypothetical protein
MAKTSEKAANNKQPESQRGKSRFAIQPRSNRSVLPDRPPREVDNEIVSILLGGDPAALAARTQDEVSPPVVQALPLSLKADIAPLVQDLQQEAEHVVSELADVPQGTEAPTLSASEITHSNANDSQLKLSPVSEVPAGNSQPQPERAASASPSRAKARATSLPLQGIGRSFVSGRADIRAQEPAISTFEEFVERWKHGLRKGQMKVCEILYQKTYALGTKECTTSFSELGRLSGLKMRQCFNIIAQLEALKFVERTKSEITSNKKDQGSIIRFYLFPKS